MYVAQNVYCSWTFYHVRYLHVMFRAVGLYVAAPFFISFLYFQILLSISCQLFVSSVLNYHIGISASVYINLKFCQVLRGGGGGAK